MQKLFNFFFEIEFYLKVVISCTIFQQFFYWVLHDIQLNFIPQVLLYWLVGSVSFYGIGLFIENVLKKNDRLREKRNVRTKKVKNSHFLPLPQKVLLLEKSRVLSQQLLSYI